LNRERIKQTVEIAGGIVALVAGVVGLAQGRPTSTIVIFTIGVFILGYALVYFWRERLPSGKRKYERLRWAATITSVLIGLMLFIAVLIPSSRHYLMYTIVGFEGPTQGVSGVVVGESAHYYRVLATVFNNQKSDAQLSRITLVLGNTGNAACLPTAEIFHIEDSVKIVASDASTRSFTGKVEARSGNLSGFKIPMTGTLKETCRSRELIFSFDSNITLKGAATTQVVVDIPRRIKADFSDFYVGPNKQSRHNGPTNLPLPTKDDERLLGAVVQTYVKFGVSIGDSNTPLSLCRQLRPNSPATPQGEDAACHL
jgi:hypothetical protein